MPSSAFIFDLGDKQQRPHHLRGQTWLPTSREGGDLFTAIASHEAAADRPLGGQLLDLNIEKCREGMGPFAAKCLNSFHQ
jgi:hypothetical protein